MEGTRVDLAWDPVEGADRYILEHENQPLIEVRAPRARLRLGQRGLTLRAFGGDTELASLQWSAFPARGGDTLYLRGRRGADSTVETLGCVRDLLEQSPAAALSEEWNPPVFPQAPPEWPRTAALFNDAKEGSFTRSPPQLLYLGDQHAYAVEPTQSFLDYDPFTPPTHRERPLTIDPRAGVAQTATRGFVVNGVGELRMLYAGGDWLVTEAATFAGETVRALAASEEGLWALSVAADAAHLRHFPGAAPANASDREFALPDFSADARYVFDGVGLLLANTAASGRVYRLAGDPLVWSDTGVVVDDLRSLHSSAVYTFATGGADGAHVTVFERATLASRGQYTLEGATDLEVMGFAEPYTMPTPP